MLMLFAPLLLKAGLGKFAAPLSKAITVLLVVGAVLGALWWLRHDAYNDGRRDERAAWEQKAAELQAIADRQQRQADQLMREAERLQRAAIARNRQEVEDATRNIPDQALSARQRARACLELRRRGQASPACEPQPAG